MLPLRIGQMYINILLPLLIWRWRWKIDWAVRPLYLDRRLVVDCFGIENCYFKICFSTFDTHWVNKNSPFWYIWLYFELYATHKMQCICYTAAGCSSEFKIKPLIDRCFKLSNKQLMSINFIIRIQTHGEIHSNGKTLNV